MDLRLGGNGDGAGQKKLIHINVLGEGCVTFEPEVEGSVKSGARSPA